MFHWMHATEPQFLVVDNDGWQHVSFEGKLKSDLLTAHVYTPELEKWKQVLDNMMKGNLDDVAVLPLVCWPVFSYRQFWRGCSAGVVSCLPVLPTLNSLRNYPVCYDFYVQQIHVEVKVFSGTISPFPYVCKVCLFYPAGAGSGFYSRL